MDVLDLDRRKSGTAQDGTAQVGTAQVGTAQVGTAQVGTAIASRFHCKAKLRRIRHSGDFRAQFATELHGATPAVFYGKFRHVIAS
jgi:hypothetical protein